MPNSIRFNGVRAYGARAPRSCRFVVLFYVVQEQSSLQSFYNTISNALSNNNGYF